MQFLVLGMHRSGTSALTRVLNLMGCYLGAEDELTPADEANPKGYFERKDAWALHERVLELCRASWYDVAQLEVESLPSEARAAFERGVSRILERLEPHRPWALKDPRAVLLLPLWRARLERPVCVLLQRDPLEVARSLQQRDGFPLAAGLALWERYTHDALLYSRGLPRVLVSYSGLLQDPVGTTAGLLAELQGQGVAGRLQLPPGDALLEFLDPALQRQRASWAEASLYLNPQQQALLERLDGGNALSDAPLPPLSVSGREALLALARAEQKRRAALELLEGILREKDRYVLSLQVRVAEQDQQLQASLAKPPSPAAPAAAPSDWSGYAACTIVSGNYLSLARTCCRSFLDQHPGAQAFVLIVDRLEVALEDECFTVLYAQDLGIHDFADFAFKYNILELNTAVKPYLLQRLFERPEVERLVYLDPDIQVFGPFLELHEALSEHEIALTPHALSPLPDDGRRPRETDFLSSGAYNLGFIALRRTPQVGQLLAWWQARLYDGAFSDPARGLFTDQKWMDLVPSFYSGVAVLRERGYNVAYWNLHERSELERTPAGEWLVAGTPLRFVHFSGYDRRQPTLVSKHQDRYRLPDLSRPYRELFAGYAAALQAHGWDETHGLPYAYGRFDNAARIPDLARRIYFHLGHDRQRFGDPFRVQGQGSFFDWLTCPVQPKRPLSPLLLGLREVRADLKQAFPDPEGRDLLPYLTWVNEHAASDFGLGAPYTGLFREALEEARRCPGPASAALDPGETGPPADAGPAPAAPEGPAQTRLKRLTAALLGEERYRALRRELIWPLYRRLRGQKPPARVQSQPLPFGVNLLGYFDTESGVGEVARGLAAMLREAQVPHVLINVEQHWLGRGDRRVRDFASAGRYAVNLLAVNADQLPQVAARHGLARGPHARNVGYWFWELSQFPARFDAAFECLDEVWVASDFCRRAIAARERRPVWKLVPAITATPAGRKSRADFGLQPGEFVFLFVFDSASVVKRKNPGAAIAAFRQAFAPDEPVRLVLKTVNASPRQLVAYDRLAGPARLRVLNGYLPHGEVLDLIAAADAYVSLHRGEGFGLTLLDALLCDKPVIATPYGGVTEFFSGTGAYPVAYREVVLQRDHGPYGRGARWADPDPQDAARQMRAVFEAWRDPSRRPAGAGAELRQRYAAQTTARALRERLEALRQELAAG